MSKPTTRRTCPVCGRLCNVDGRCYAHYPAPGRRNYGLTAKQAYAISHCYVCNWPLCLDYKQYPNGAVCHNPGCRKLVAKTDEENANDAKART